VLLVTRARHTVTPATSNESFIPQRAIERNIKSAREPRKKEDEERREREREEERERERKGERERERGRKRAILAVQLGTPQIFNRHPLDHHPLPLVSSSDPRFPTPSLLILLSRPPTPDPSSIRARFCRVHRQINGVANTGRYICPHPHRPRSVQSIPLVYPPTSFFHSASPLDPSTEPSSSPRAPS